MISIILKEKRVGIFEYFDMAWGKIIEWIAYLGGAAIGIAGFWTKVGKPLWNYAKTLKERNEKIDRIYYELTPNGNGSMKDQLNRVENRQILLEQKHKIQANKLELAYVRFDNQGLCVESSLYLNRILNRSESELLGNQWLHWICPNDKTRVTQEWREAVATKTIFSCVYCVAKPDNSPLKIEVVIEPMSDSLGFFGTVEEVIESVTI